MPAHFPPLWQPLRLVVSGTDFIALSVGQLKLDQIRVPSLLIQQRARHAAKAVSGVLIA